MEQDVTGSHPKTSENTNNIGLKIFGFLFLCILFLGILMLFCEYYPFSEGPPAPSTQNLLGLSMLVSIPIIFGSMCVLPVPIALIICGFASKGRRIWLFLFSALSIICLLIQVGLYNIMPQFKHNACRVIVSNGQVLVDAISSYQRDHNSYPESLEVLVPKYINKIPETGIRGFPYYEYEIVDLTDYECLPPEMKIKGIYELRVKLERIFKWDRVFYWPTENYPKGIYGGDVEKIGNWAYVDE